MQDGRVLLPFADAAQKIKNGGRGGLDLAERFGMLPWIAVLQNAMVSVLADHDPDVPVGASKREAQHKCAVAEKLETKDHCGIWV